MQRKTYEDWVATLTDGFRSLGCSKSQAVAVSEALVLTEAAGVTSHGLSMVSSHAQKIKRGEYNLSEEPSIDIQTPALTKVDAHGTIGLYSAGYCMDIAIANAKKYGMHTVLVHNANTLGAAFVYALQAASAGMIGLVMSNSPAQMAPIGGKDKLFGTNPLSYAVPAQNERPIVFDMATSVVAKSKILQAKKKGDIIPDGWAADANGIPTNDPEKALSGLVLPMAGAKGYGLSMMIDLISGLLSNAYFLDNVCRFYNNTEPCMNVGHTFICINPKIVFEGGDFYAEVDKYIRKVKSSHAIDGEEIRVPGENKWQQIDKAKSIGLMIPQNLAEDIERTFTL